MFDFDSLLPPGLNLYPYQTCGVATALLERRVILGDEMGLGKSVQALVALEAADAYPAVIVCPASLRANWAKEIARFLPHREAFTAYGKPAGRGAEIVVISYSLLQSWLAVFDPAAVVLDESHYAINPARRRTKAANALVKMVPEQGLVLALTGTVFVNKPVELAAQLQLVGRLHALTPTPDNPNDERAWVRSFHKEWCEDVSSMRQLNRALRQTCYMRRQRADVLGRKDTQRQVVTVSLDLAEYREAEDDLIAYLTERDGTEAAARAATAEGLARLSHLRRLVGEAKAWAARQWIDNFLESNPDRSLVVFAYHKSVQNALVDFYKCPSILGGGDPSDVEANKEAFQRRDHRLIVVSLTAGREGHTLTRASDVLHVELGWTPGVHDQADARVNRIGQQAEDTFGWYLLGADTVDIPVWKIIEGKRALFQAAAEGRGAEGTDQSTATEVLDGYRHYQRTPHASHALISNVVPIRRRKEA